jgi:hypothetical protein
MYVCILALVIRQAMRARAMLYCQLPPVWLYHIFPHYLTNGTIFGKTITEHKTCASSVQLLSEIFLILRRIQRGTNTNVGHAAGGAVG